jgi:hypothetical protein
MGGGGVKGSSTLQCRHLSAASASLFQRIASPRLQIVTPGNLTQKSSHAIHDKPSSSSKDGLSAALTWWKRGNQYVSSLQCTARQCSQVAKVVQLLYMQGDNELVHHLRMIMSKREESGGLCMSKREESGGL